MKNGAGEKIKKHEVMRDLIAGLLSRQQLVELVRTLERVGKHCGDTENCNFVADQLKTGYYNWTGENLEV